MTGVRSLSGAPVVALAAVALATALLSVVPARALAAQPARPRTDRSPSVRAQPPRPAPAPRDDDPLARSSLDGWLVTRYRDAQLLEDTVPGTRAMPSAAPFPRVESSRAAGTGDTLFAVHFNAGRDEPVLRAGGLVRLSEPSGAISSRSARVLVRRPFRAPAVPGAALRPGTRTDKAGRYGWGYLLVVSRAVVRTSSKPLDGAWRGWLLVEQPDTIPRRADTSRSAGAAGATGAPLRTDSVRADTLPP